MKDDLDDKEPVPEDIFSDDMAEEAGEDISIHEFIKRKRLQNKILGEIIDKIRNEEIGQKPQELPDSGDK